ncbi:MAG TPA: MASE1 domain-containing protein, partial [Oceanipulchritudo sp.]|nr:MASE1 domain-containing protein [Oceanipulchritudo sp.]
MEPGFPSDKRTLSILFNHTIAFLLYVGSAYIGYELVLDSSGVSLIWPPAGVGIALVLMRGLSHLPVIFAGAVVVYLLPGGGLPGALVTASGYTLAAALTALALNRFMGFHVNLATLKDACAFTVVAVVLLPLVSALAGALTRCCLEPVGTENFEVLLGKHWIGDVVGILVFA